jgi:hypothetical protein
MKSKSSNYYKYFTVMIPVIILILYINRVFFINAVSSLPPCPIHTYLHIYCPACGNTRCVKALLHGSLLTALRYNITPLLLGIILLFAYIELAFFSFGKPIRILPRRLSVYIILIAFLFLYYILRNCIPYLTP